LIPKSDDGINTSGHIHPRKMIDCTKCGKQMNEDMRFCPYCGQPVQSEDIERFEPSRGEVITAVASPAHIVGRDGVYAMAFTDERVVFARIGEASFDKAKGELLQAGIFLPGSTASINVSRFYEMTPAQALAEEKDNFYLENSDVETVRLAYDSDDGGRYVATIRTSDGEIKVTLPYDRYYRDLLFRQYEGRIVW